MFTECTSGRIGWMWSVAFASTGGATFVPGAPCAGQSGSLVQWGATSHGQSLAAPMAGERFVAITTGDYHCLALHADGSLVQWGDSAIGQAANAPPSGDRFIAIAAGSLHNLALHADDAVARMHGLRGRQMGLLAQDVARVFPDWVDAGTDGYLMVTERATTALMVEALRDLRAEKDAALAEKQAQIEALQARLERLERMLEENP